MTIIQEIDPKGDTLLNLRNANTRFPPCHYLEDWPNQLPRYCDTQSKFEESGLMLSQFAATSFFKSKPQSDQPDMQIRVSSKHMTLASEYFQRMAANDWKEGIPQGSYTYTINATDWNYEALLIVLNIIHGRTRSLPKKISIDLLAQVAQIVDYYQCHEPVEFFVRIRASELDKTENLSYKYYGKSLLLRLSSAWVFKETDIFYDLTRTVLRYARGTIHALVLPGLPQTTEALERRRVGLISKIINKLDDVVHSLSQNNSKCSFECSAILLGALVKGMQNCKLREPRPKPPFHGFSLDALVRGIRDFQSPRWLSSRRDERFHPCNLATYTTPIIEEVQQEIQGLTLEEVRKGSLLGSK